MTVGHVSRAGGVEKRDSSAVLGGAERFPGRGKLTTSTRHFGSFNTPRMHRPRSSSTEGRVFTESEPPTSLAARASHCPQGFPLSLGFLLASGSPGGGRGTFPVGLGGPAGRKTTRGDRQRPAATAPTRTPLALRARWSVKHSLFLKAPESLTRYIPSGSPLRTLIFTFPADSCGK